MTVGVITCGLLVIGQRTQNYCCPTS